MFFHSRVFHIDKFGRGEICKAYSELVDPIVQREALEDQAKAIEDILIIYERERLNSRKLDILNLLDQSENEEKKKLEKELSDIIIKLAKFKH